MTKSCLVAGNVLRLGDVADKEDETFYSQYTSK